MSMFVHDPVIAGASAMVIKATALLAVVAVGQAVLARRTSAAMRHLAWTVTAIALILLPALSVVLPEWPVLAREAAPMPTATEDVAVKHEADVPASAVSIAGTAPDVDSRPIPATARAAGTPWSTVMIGIYGAGVLLLLVHLVIQRVSVRRILRGAEEIRDPEWIRVVQESAAVMDVAHPIRLLRGREGMMPMAVGMWRPAILLPADADRWPEDRRRAVVLHEAAHIARYDCLTQSVAFAACIIYWFHPAAWWAARRLRVERELACDDRVIRSGARARDYAGHLLEIAYSFGRQRVPALVVSMARPRQLEGRMLAVLDAARNRHVPTLRARLAGGLVAAAVLIPLAAATPAGSVAPEEAPGAARPAESTAASQREEPADVRTHTIVSELVRRAVRSVTAAFAAVQDRLPGTWEIRPTKTDGTVHLRLAELNSSSGSDVPLQQLEGLTAAQLAAGGPVNFRIRRDAGTLTFEGIVRGGVGAGTFAFTPDASFPAEIATRGFARPTAAEQYQMARHDIGYAYVDELNRQGYAKPDTAELVRAGQHGVRLDYLREMGALGYRLGSLAPLIRLRDHGVTPTYISELAAQGYKGLPADDLRNARDHGVTPEYVRTMRDAGYGSLSMQQLINARDHGVTGEFVRGLDAAGHTKLSLEQVIRVRDHGVTAEYAREMRALGHAVSIDELVRARDHGVSLEFVREMAALGHSKLSLDALIRLRDHGVTPEYVRELKALGYDGLAIEELVTLRDHGLTPDRIRRANARAGTRLPIDLLRSFASGGFR